MEAIKVTIHAKKKKKKYARSKSKKRKIEKTENIRRDNINKQTGKKFVKSRNLQSMRRENLSVKRVPRLR